MNKKLSHKDAVDTLKHFFMEGGAKKKINICKKNSKRKECSINRTGLRPEWCEMESDMSCIYSNEGLRTVSDNKITKISNRLGTKPQKMNELKKKLKKTTNKDLKVLCNILEISSNGKKEILIANIINNRIRAILYNNDVWSFY